VLHKELLHLQVKQKEDAGNQRNGKGSECFFACLLMKKVVLDGLFSTSSIAALLNLLEQEDEKS
jgi:hypothetical protein